MTDISNIPESMKHLIDEDPVEKQPQFTNRERFIRHCQRAYGGYTETIPDMWLTDLQMVMEWLFRFHRHEQWLQHASESTPGIFYQIYTRHALHYSLYGVYPGRDSLVRDVIESLSDVSKALESTMRYRSSQEHIHPSAQALWTLWADINEYFQINTLSPRMIHLRLHHPVLRFKMFYGLSLQYETDLLDGHEITSSRPAERWLDGLEKLYALINSQS